MSTTDDLFLLTGLPVEEAGRQVADALGPGLHPYPSGDFVLAGKGFAESPGVTKADVRQNIYLANDLYADDSAAYDATDVVLEFQRPDKDLAAQQSGARHAMHLLVERFGWCAVLVHNVSVLIATWDPVSGWRERPLTSGMLADLQGRLVRDTPAHNEHAGRLRDIQVMIGGHRGARVQDAGFVPPPPGVELEHQLRDLLRWMMADHLESIDPVVAAGMAHYHSRPCTRSTTATDVSVGSWSCCTCSTPRC